MRMVKNNSDFVTEFTQDNLSLSARISQTVSASTFWNLSLGYRIFNQERYNPFFKKILRLMEIVLSGQKDLELLY